MPGKLAAPRPNEVDHLVDGFYVVGTDKNLLIRRGFKSAGLAKEEGFKLGVPFAVLEVFDPFNNYAWGEREGCPEGTHFDPETGTCVPDDTTEP